MKACEVTREVCGNTDASLSLDSSYLFTQWARIRLFDLLQNVFLTSDFKVLLAQIGRSAMQASTCWGRVNTIVAGEISGSHGDE
jgi:hypothetical protein